MRLAGLPILLASTGQPVSPDPVLGEAGRLCEEDVTSNRILGASFTCLPAHTGLSPTPRMSLAGEAEKVLLLKVLLLTGID